jgi:hypothetical protein
MVQVSCKSQRAGLLKEMQQVAAAAATGAFLSILDSVNSSINALA